MNEELIANLKKEIEADVDGRYAGKTAKELVSLINEPFIKETSEDIMVPIEPVEIEPVEVDKELKTIVHKEKKEAPVWRVISGIDGGPNIVTEEDIINALK